ncbi:MAG TPA: acyl-CoA dehydrogenase family protein, partial [Longimicrobiales bacterium]|nr:acyl-CoA dehydrogenase family protein [Longimicrobiales bacterium]
MPALTAEQLEIRELARDFARGELRPHSARWDAEGALDDEVFGALGELGFLGMLAPEAHGGLELDLVTYLLVLEELAWGDAAVALSVAIHDGPVTGLLVGHGSETQKAEWLPGLASGALLGAFALSEAEAGSDAAALRARAVRNGDAWILEGEKKWVTNGARAGVVAVFAQTDEEGGIGCFLVEPSTGGYEVVGRATTMGLRASETVHVRLDGVRVEAEG